MSESETNPNVDTPNVDTQEETQARSKMSAAELLRVCMNPGQESPTAPGEEATHGNGTPTTAEATPEAIPANVTEAAKPVTPPAHRATPQAKNSTANLAFWNLGQLVGMGLAACGAMVLLAPHVSEDVANLLAPHGQLRDQAGTLVVSGLCVFMVSILMHSLRRMRDTLDEVSFETVRIQAIADDAQHARDSIERLSVENRSLIREVVHLQGKLRRLIEIVSNPDYTASIFRLAASVDQLGKQVDVSMKGQFAEIERQVTAIAQHATQAEKQLLAAVAVIPPLVKEQHKLQQASLVKGIGELHSAAELTDARIDETLRVAARIEGAVQAEIEAASANYAKLSESAANMARDLAGCLDDLRGHVTRTAEDDRVRFHEEFERLVDRVDLGERAQQEHVQHSMETLQGRILEQVDDLQRCLARLEHASDRDRAEFAEGFSNVHARIEQSAGEQQAVLGENRAETRKDLDATRDELTAGIELLATRLEELDALQQTRAERASQNARAIADGVQAGISERIAKLEAQLDQAARDQEALAREFALSAQNDVQTAREALAAGLSAIEGRVVEARQANETCVRESYENSGRGMLAAKQELVEKLRGLENWIAEAQQANESCLRQAATDTVREVQAARTELVERLAAVEHSNENRGAEAQRGLQRVEDGIGEYARNQKNVVEGFDAAARERTFDMNREALARLDELGARFGQMLSQRSDELTKDMLEIAAIYSALTDEMLVRAGANLAPTEPQDIVGDAAQMTDAATADMAADLAGLVEVGDEAYDVALENGVGETLGAECEDCTDELARADATSEPMDGAHGATDALDEPSNPTTAEPENDAQAENRDGDRNDPENRRGEFGNGL